MDYVAAPTAASKSDFELSKSCEKCGRLFEPRLGSGGKPQRFCSTECRQAFHTKSQRGQRSPTCSAPVTLPAIRPPEAENNARAAAVEDFDWSNTESIALHEQPETAIYFNPKGDLVIRQRCWPDDDSVIRISENNISQFIDRLTYMVGIPGFPP